MIIAKFGGTSVSSVQSIKTLCSIVSKEADRNPVVVVSALSGVTDFLLSLPGLAKNQSEDKIQTIKNLHFSLIKGLWEREFAPKECFMFIDEQINEIKKCLNINTQNKASLDKIASFGEIMSSYIIAQALNKIGINAKQIIATKLIVTDDNFGSADFLPNPTKINIKKILTPLIKKGAVPVVTGFIGSTKKGQVTTLGRGGSDYTASIIGFCLEALEIQIWTDVDGVFTADPRLVKKAKLLPEISFKEASELATFGARVLHPHTIRPAIKMGIPVRVLNTFNIGNKGTLIKGKVSNFRGVRAISYKRKIVLINIYSSEMLLQIGFLAKVFKVFADNNISVDLVSVSEVSISVSLDNGGKGLIKAIKQLSLFASVSVIENLGMVSLIGEGITSSVHTIKKIFDILDKEKILVRMISLGATDINISLVIEAVKVEKAVKILHDII